MRYPAAGLSAFSVSGLRVLGANPPAHWPLLAAGLVGRVQSCRRPVFALSAAVGFMHKMHRILYGGKSGADLRRICRGPAGGLGSGRRRFSPGVSWRQLWRDAKPVRLMICGELP